MDCILLHLIAPGNSGEPDIKLYVPQAIISEYLEEDLEEFLEVFREPVLTLPAWLRASVARMEKDPRVKRVLHKGKKIPGLPEGVRVVGYAARVCDY